jgi:sporulation protein YlmC with PRC-barrel domain
VLDLVRDVLDKQILDVKGRPFGKVDGVVIEVRPDAAPRVIALEVGAATRLARLPRRLTRSLGGFTARATATRIPREAVLAVAREIRVSVDATRTPAWRVEAWLARVLARIPGGR